MREPNAAEIESAKRSRWYGYVLLAWVEADQEWVPVRQGRSREDIQGVARRYIVDSRPAGLRLVLNNKSSTMRESRNGNLHRFWR